MKIVFILHDIHKSLGMEWLANGLLENNIQIAFILINNEMSEMEQFLGDCQIETIRIPYKSRPQIFSFTKKLCKEIRRLKPDIVHTHLRNADIFGQLAALLCGVKTRIYTRHSSTFNHVYHKKSVLIDKVINSIATHIVAISKVTQQVLVEMENVARSKVTLIHHGFDLSSFDDLPQQRVIAIKCKHYIPDNRIIIGVIARYTEWKGYQYIIPALGRLKEKHSQLHFIFANATGDYQPIINKLLDQYLNKDDYTEIKFESDVQALYKLLDIYVHVPINSQIEAFGQTYVEALASGVPSIFTLSGVANEFIIHEKNALVVDYKNSDEIFEAVEQLINNISLRQQLIINGKFDVKQFNTTKFINAHVELYNSLYTF